MNTTSTVALVAVASLFVSPVAALAQETAQVQPAAASAPAADEAAKPATLEPEKKICRKIESSTSHMVKRTCLTAKEWQQIDEDR